MLNAVASFGAGYRVGKAQGFGALKGTSKGAVSPSDLIGTLIAVVIGVSLYPVIVDVIGDVNASGVEATLLNLIPTLYVIGVIVGAIAWLGMEAM